MKERNKLVVIIFAALLFLLIQIGSVHASMKLYISDDCQNCDEMLEKGKKTTQLLEDKGGIRDN